MSVSLVALALALPLAATAAQVEDNRELVRRGFAVVQDQENFRRRFNFAQCAIRGTACSRDTDGAYLLEGALPCCSPSEVCELPPGATFGAVGTCVPRDARPPANASFAAARDIAHRCHRFGAGAQAGAKCLHDGFAVVLPVHVDNRIKLKAASITLWSASTL